MIELSRGLLHVLCAQRNPLRPDLTMWPIQLGMAGDPWRIMVTCVLLNQTTGKQVRPVLADLLSRWPSPHALLAAGGRELGEVVQPLGLLYRAAVLMRLTEDFVGAGWEEAEDLPGVGPYAADALRIFALGDLACRPADRVLAAFVQQILGKAVDKA